MRTGNKWIYVVALAFSLFEIVPVKAQEPGATAPAPPAGWRKMGEAPPASPQPVPAQLTVPAGTWITIRVDQALSSDRNQVAKLHGEPGSAAGDQWIRGGPPRPDGPRERLAKRRRPRGSHLDCKITKWGWPMAGR